MTGLTEYPGRDLMTDVPSTDPMMVAWESYRASANYANTRKWATKDRHVDGSLWAAFCEGWSAGRSETRVQ